MYGQFQYDLNDLVQLVSYGPVFTVRWRGWLFENTNGANLRTEVYWLGPVHWDCYFADQLYPLGKAPPPCTYYIH